MSDAFLQPQPGGSVKKVAVYRNEVLLSQGHHPEPPIPDTILTKWQNIVNLMAEMLDVPAALITRIVGEEIHVFVSSGTEGNPYQRGDSQHFWNSGLYCETVVTKNHELLIPNALLDEAWRNNPQVRLNLISYLGYLIRWPDGTPFGTMCVFDCKTNSYSEKYKRLIIQFRDIVEIHLEIIYTEAQRREELERLVDERTASLQLAVAQQIEANNRVRRLVDANIIGIFLWNFEGQITEANEAFLQMLNYSREDLVSGRLNWRNLTPPEWRDLTNQSVAQLKATGTLQPYEKEYFRMDGTRVPVLVGSAVLKRSERRGLFCDRFKRTETRRA